MLPSMSFLDYLELQGHDSSRASLSFAWHPGSGNHAVTGHCAACWLVRLLQSIFVFIQCFCHYCRSPHFSTSIFLSCKLLFSCFAWLVGFCLLAAALSFFCYPFTATAVDVSAASAAPAAAARRRGGWCWWRFCSLLGPRQYQSC